MNSQKAVISSPNHPFSVAPMIDWSDRHFRYFVRLMSKRALLYTEMITTGAILHGPRDRLLAYSPEEHPLAIQLGGSDPSDLAQCALIAEEAGFDEINLNLGCPSDRVQRGRFGACLMSEPELVATCIQAMQEKVRIPVTAKTRIGIDEHDSYDFFRGFIIALKESGCQHFIIHARKAWLSGLSPKENREIPPLHYDYVFKLKSEYPDLNIVLNGGITTLTTATDLIEQGVDGVMLGRAAYHNPFIMASVDRLFYGDSVTPIDRHTVIEQYADYIAREMRNGVPFNSMARHTLGIFHEQFGGKKWRRCLSENSYRYKTPEDITPALALLREALNLTQTD